MRALAFSRIGHRIGTVPPQVLKEIDRALRQQQTL
ncbi:hypothetical protein [Streptomyces sp. NBC_00576]|nr:hypothetical protein [Streptomyces sp. NBC_00576]WUB77469.1 type II toxin-antitoxin system PemK/MazF family toxin [Streptomyces sp. NBC_00576]